MRAIVLLTTTVALFSSLIVVGLGQSMIVDDFKSNPDQRWVFIADRVMGGVSSGKVEFKTDDGVSYAHLTGKVSTANNGGFVQIRSKIEKSPSANVTGVKLVVRGNDQKYFVHVRTSGTLLPWQYYQASYNVTSKWREVRIPLSKFERSSRVLRKTPSVKSIKSLAVVAFGRDHDADIQVREIGFY